MSDDIISKTFKGGFVTTNSGSSHFTADSNPDQAHHITTNVGGLKQGFGVDVKVDVDSNGNIGNPYFDIKFPK